jgi:tRNA (guanine37-N1)-methyltransferase
MALHFDILTVFPEAFEGIFSIGMVRKARQAGQVTIAIHNLRDFTADRHQTTDDTPYGGGGGMVMKPEPIFRAVESLLAQPDLPADDVPVILLTPQGRIFTQAVARELAGRRRLILICGRYEGVDERVREFLVTDEISIGDYVLSGGEIAAMAIVEATVRLLPGVLGDPGATFEDSHAEGLLEYPHYTRPADFRGHRVPAELLSGNHAEIVRWRRRQSLKRTLERRPDLLERAILTDEDLRYLAALGYTPSRQDPTPAGET